MKAKYNLLLILMLMGMSFCLTSCSDDDDTVAKVAPSATGTYTDPRDGNEYRWVRYGNLEWLADNFRYDTGDESTCMIYNGINSNGPVDENVYGRLYTYKAAVAACPDGWRLPTDADWQNLEMAMGMSASQAGSWEWRGHVAKNMMSIYEEKNDFNVLMAGWYFPHAVMGVKECRYFGTYAVFWTASKDGEQGKGDGFYIYRKFLFNSDQVYRQSTSDEMGMSVRYVRDAQ